MSIQTTNLALDGVTEIDRLADQLRLDERTVSAANGRDAIANQLDATIAKLTATRDTLRAWPVGSQ